MVVVRRAIGFIVVPSHISRIARLWKSQFDCLLVIVVDSSLSSVHCLLLATVLIYSQRSIALTYIRNKLNTGIIIALAKSNGKRFAGVAGFFYRTQSTSQISEAKSIFIVCFGSNPYSMVAVDCSSEFFSPIITQV